MTIIVLLVFALVAGVVLFRVADSWSGDWGVMTGGLVMILSGSVLIICAISIPANRLAVHAGIQRFRSLQTTIAVARLRGESIENAALQLKIAEENQGLAAAQFYNASMFDLWIPDEVEKLEPIQ